MTTEMDAPHNSTGSHVSEMSTEFPHGSRFSFFTMTKQCTLALDLGTQTGWATHSSGVTVSGTVSFKSGRYEGGGMRFLRFRKWLKEMFEIEKPNAVYFEEVRRHLSTDSSHVYGGLLAILTAEAEAHSIAYQGIPVQTIKRHATGKGNAKKDAMIAAAKSRWPDHNIEDDNQADALWILSTAMEGKP